MAALVRSAYPTYLAYEEAQLQLTRLAASAMLCNLMDIYLHKLEPRQKAPLWRHSSPLFSF